MTWVAVVAAGFLGGMLGFLYAQYRETKQPLMLDSVERVRQELHDLANDKSLPLFARAAYRDSSRAVAEVVRRFKVRG